MAELYVALVHHPVYDKNRQVVTTSITTIDLHDIARSCRTYGVKAFYVVTPVDALRSLSRRVLKHWKEGFGASYNPNRREALELVRLEPDLEAVAIDIEQATGKLPVWVATSARRGERATGFAELAREMDASDSPYLLLLGTGWGLTEEVIDRAAHRLAPIDGAGDYNHLSVRGAAAILLDRLRGTR